MAIVTYPHGPLTHLASNLWMVTAPTSQGLDRKMTVARGDDGTLLLYDALWLDESTFAQLDALGPVKTIFVPSYTCTTSTANASGAGTRRRTYVARAGRSASSAGRA